MSEIKITELNIYPIKSCGPISNESAQMTETGFTYDREWVITRPNGSFISQRTNPELALVTPSIREDKLIVDAPIVGRTILPLNSIVGEEQEIEIFKKIGTGIDQGDTIANYFSDYLGKPVRVFRNAQPRKIKEECRVDGASIKMGFADGFQVTLASQKSLSELNTYAKQPIKMSSFRPNIVVDGEDLEAYDEDYWQRIRVGKELGLITVRACDRCPIPNIDQLTGILPKPVERFTTAALQASRRGIDPVNDKEGTFFTQNLAPLLPVDATIYLGDSIIIEQRSSQKNFLSLSE